VIVKVNKPPSLAALFKVTTMDTNRPEPNAELQQSFEPLRIGFAILALLLGALAALHL
jgi:hypothetical protein